MHRATDAGVKRWESLKLLCLLLAPSKPALTADLCDPDWDTLVEMASIHFVTPALATALQREEIAPDEIKKYFSLFHELNAGRNRTILRAAREILAALEGIGVEAVALKGVANLATRLYGDPAERVLSDVDILVRPAQINEAAAMLCRLGYGAEVSEERSRRWVRPVTRPPRYHLEMTHRESGVGVEIHRALLRADFDAILGTEAVFATTNAIDWEGQRVLVPSPTHRLIHNIAHDQLHHSRYSKGAIQLLQLRELALIALRHGDAIDWQEVERRFNRAGQGQVLRQHVAHCFIFMGAQMPIAQANPEQAAALIRIRMIKRSKSKMFGRLASLYVQNFARDPLLTLNLLNPLWWPQRLRGMREFLLDRNST